MIFQEYFLILLAYLIGSFPSALVIGKSFKNVDIRKHGSGNLGTTNTFRVLGFKAGISVFFLDVFKGMVVILLIKILKIDTNNIHLIVYGMVSAFGHVFPIFAKFKGGKAVATSFGFALAITPLITSIVFLTFIATLILFKYVSVASTIAAICVATLGLTLQNDLTISIAYCILCFFILFKHKKNYVRLIKGTESKILQKKQS